MSHDPPWPTRGRQPDKLYDEAFRKWNAGFPFERVYQEWLKQVNKGAYSDPQLRENFLKALKRRARETNQA